ncbi:hypothetical protein BGZ94_010071, partial [Podila epigama]
MSPKLAPAPAYPQERSHHKRFSQRYGASCTSSYTEYSSALAASYSQHIRQQQQQQQQQQHRHLQSSSQRPTTSSSSSSP